MFNTNLITPRNLFIILIIAFIWLWWGKRFVNTHVSESATA